MSASILYCSSCKQYTLQFSCPICRKPTTTTRPAKFSLDDKWGRYRREARKQTENL